jgi:hypothetical protein
MVGAVEAHPAGVQFGADGGEGDLRPPFAARGVDHGQAGEAGLRVDPVELFGREPGQAGGVGQGGAVGRDALVDVETRRLEPPDPRAQVAASKSRMVCLSIAPIANRPLAAL